MAQQPLASTRQAIAVVGLAAAIGMPGAFFTIALPVLMRDGGASLMAVGLTWVVWLPSALKWIWAPSVGRLAFADGGSPIRWLRGLVIAIALCFLPVAWLAAGPAVVPLLILSLLSAVLATTIQLVIAGCLMAETEARRARLNGFTVAGMVLGGAFGGGLMPVIATRIGWEIAVPTLACLILLVVLPVSWLVSDRSKPYAPQESGLWDFATALKAPGTGKVLLLLLLLAGSSGADATLPARLIDVGLPVAQVLVLLGTVATLLTVPSGLLAGWALSRWGWVPVLSILCIAKAATLLALVALPSASAPLAVWDFMLAGAMTVGVWQCYMAASQSVTPVTRYGLVTSLDAGVRFLAAMASGAIAGSIGYGPTFAGFATLCFLSAVAVILTGRSVVEEKAPPEHSQVAG